MKHETIQLNGITYDRTNFNQLYVSSEPDDSWQNAIYFFLQNWFDETDSVLANTSGSTGKPKEIRLTKTAMMNSARMTNHFFELNASNTALLCLPASYIAGKMMLVRAMVGGFNLLTVEPSANPFKELQVPIDFAAITPYQLIYSAETLHERHVSKIIVGGSQVTDKHDKLAEHIPAELYETYGMTETCSHIALRKINGFEKSDHFTALKGVDIHLDNRGCLVIYAPHLLEYEVHTNDIVEMVRDDSFRWLGRIDAVINTGGIKIHPNLVEKKLGRTISSNYFISSIPDLVVENKVVLVLESEKQTAQEEEVLKNAMEKLLGKFEMPRHIFYIPSFVYSSGNKVLRKETLAEARKG